ncbi:hypothetical protein F4779DRAFT_635761 [Xylariaceae sp. FL0662B]|nr:hypothetical protein F4779DRAFT_635761 [Xylariaceae sp. FL0662B]
MCAVTMRGGLKIIFEALQQSHFYSEEVYRALEDIPFIISQHAPYIDMYRKDENLHTLNSSLHASIFRLLQLLLSWFSDSRAMATVKMGLNPKRYPERLKERIAEIKTSQTRFDNHASLLRNRETREFQLRAATELHHIRHKLSEKEQHMEIYSRVDVLDKLEKHLQQTKEIWQGTMLDIYRSLSPDPRQAAANDRNARKKILTEYEYNPSVVRNDCMSLPNGRGRLSRDQLDQERIAAIRGNPRLHAWLILDQSSMLLLEGGAERPTNNEASFVAARVVEGALELSEQKPENITKEWLKGLYSSRRSYLLSAGFDAATLQECHQGISVQDVESIFNAFEELILKLPKETIVLLVIDGLRWFSQPLDRGREMNEAITRLVNIYRKRPQATLKFLFTSPSKTSPFNNMFSDDEILRIPRDLPSRGGYRQSRLNAKINFVI